MSMAKNQNSFQPPNVTCSLKVGRKEKILRTQIVFIEIVLAVMSPEVSQGYLHEDVYHEYIWWLA